MAAQFLLQWGFPITLPPPLAPLSSFILHVSPAANALFPLFLRVVWNYMLPRSSAHSLLLQTTATDLSNETLCSSRLNWISIPAHFSHRLGRAGKCCIEYFTRQISNAVRTAEKTQLILHFLVKPKNAQGLLKTLHIELALKWLQGAVMLLMNRSQGIKKTDVDHYYRLTK